MGVGIVDLAVLIALLALGLSFYNFYHSHLRIKNSLYLVKIDEIFSSSIIFGIVNDGNKDVLITSVRCWLSNPKGKNKIYPDQKTEVGGNDLHVLEHGKFQKYVISFDPPLNKESFEEAEEVGGKLRYEAEIHISWIDNKSDYHHKKIHYLTYDYYTSGGTGVTNTVALETNKYNLYKAENSDFKKRNKNE